MNNKNNHKKKECLFCKNGIDSIDYHRDLDIVKRYITPYAKILSKDRTGNCPKHQRMIAKAIKNARIMALLPFVYR